MTLDLKEPRVPLYKDFSSGESLLYLDQMPLLLSGRDSRNRLIDVPRTPISVAGVFERRLNSFNQAWFSNYFHTGDSVVTPPDEAYSDRRFKVRRNSESLRRVSPKTELFSGGLSVASYEDISGVEFIAGKDGVILDKDMTKDEAIDSPVWLELFGGNVSFRDAVVDKVFYEGKCQYGSDRMMGLYLCPTLSQACERALCVSRLGLRSRLVGRCNLDNDYGRLVGLAPEAQSALDRVLRGS